MREPDFWRDRQRAENKSRRFEELKEEIETWNNIKKENKTLLELANESLKEEDFSIKNEIEDKLLKLKEKFNELEFFILLSEKYDKNNAIISIHAGAGGVDAQDWAGMLLRMYLRYCQKKGWSVKIHDKSVGSEAGIKSVTFAISGSYAFGFLKSENGVHRLVRISPFDAEKMRHTSFALVEVIPELEKDAEVEIKDKNIRIDTFMASGHGGQSVNKTDSAVRITHLPTKITVSCQNERSQRQNKENALKILKSRLHQISEKQRQQKKEELRGEYHEAAWGNQIRSYVLHPYQMVKDHRTDYEQSNIEEILDGEIDKFIEYYLRKK